MSSFHAMMSRGFLSLVIVAASVAFYARAQAQSQDPPDLILRVDGDEGSPAGDGHDWGAYAFRFLQDAITEAVYQIANNQNVTTVWIWVAETNTDNPYRPDRDSAHPLGTGDRTATFLLREGVSLFGGFVGGETELSQRNPETHETVLTGYQPDLTGAECPTSGGPCDEAPHPPGCDDGWCCQQVCYGENGLPQCCEIEWFPDCAEAALDICPRDAFHVVTGHGVDESARLDGFTITRGNADGPDNDGFGGGILLTAGLVVQDDAHPLIVRCRIMKNHARYGGGLAEIVAPPSGLLSEVIDCAFIDNDAEEDGGGVHAGEGSGGTYTNCLFARNDAINNGGAMVIRGDRDHELINCTIVANTAGDNGAGVFVDETTENPVVVTLDNSILWDNTDSGGQDESAQLFVLAGAGGSVTLGFSDIEGSGLPAGVTDGGGNIHVDPRFADAAARDYRLGKLCSRCIDRADNIPVPPDEYDVDTDGNDSEYTPDLDVLERILDGLQDGSAIVDMGSYEFIPPPCPWDCQDSPNGEVDVADFLAILAQFGQKCTSCDFGLGAAGVGVEEFLAFLAHFGPCGVGGGTMPQSVQDCIDRFGLEDPQILQACICAIDPCEEGCPPEECK